jgi:hypothetical protein
VVCPGTDLSKALDNWLPHGIPFWDVGMFPMTAISEDDQAHLAIASRFGHELMKV